MIRGSPGPLELEQPASKQGAGQGNQPAERGAPDETEKRSQEKNLLPRLFGLPFLGLLVKRRHVALAALEVGHALLHPLRPRLPQQEGVAELVLVDGPVLLVLALAEAVFLGVVVED